MSETLAEWQARAVQSHRDSDLTLDEWWAQVVENDRKRDVCNKFLLTESQTSLVNQALGTLMEKRSSNDTDYERLKTLKRLIRPHSQNGFRGLCGMSHCKCSS